MHRGALLRFASRAPQFQEVSEAWRSAMRDCSVRTVPTWRTLRDDEVGSHLAGFASLAPWWDSVARACPLVASPVAERVLCETRAHFARLLVSKPSALPVAAREPLLSMARALAAQGQQSEHAYMFYDAEFEWARHLQCASPTGWVDVAEALLPAFPAKATRGAEDIALVDGPDNTVRFFYEECPIPRWVDLAPWERPEMLAEPIQTAGKAGSSVLVAGCGTGRWACHFAATFPGASVLGVDISETSIAYAHEQKSRFGLQNLGLGCVDLRTWSPESRFDFIECGGVLHHLENPEATWSRMAHWLKPDGVMLVSLYSRAARLPLKKLRRTIMPKVLPPGVNIVGPFGDDVLRNFRQELLGMAWSSDSLQLAQLARSPDLHSLSRLRDAFFHPLEHEYSLLEVQAMMDRLGLKCLGLDADRNLASMLLKAKPSCSLTDLHAWHELEQSMPEAFLGMYEIFAARNA